MVGALWEVLKKKKKRGRRHQSLAGIIQEVF
jgi:hypothetical protein